MPSLIAGNTPVINRGFARRSGETNNTSHSPRSSAFSIRSHSSSFVLFIDSALILIRAADSIWFLIKDNNGLIRTVTPEPCSLSSLVAKKYTTLLPQPVRWTTNVRCLLSTDSIASHCPSRNTASAPNICLINSSPRSRNILHPFRYIIIFTICHSTNYKLILSFLQSVFCQAPLRHIIFLLLHLNFHIVCYRPNYHQYQQFYCESIC